MAPSTETASAAAPAPRQFIVIGPTPPPIHGVAFLTVHLVEGMRRAGALCAHLETGEDERLVQTSSRLDLLNAWFAFRHTALLACLLARHRRADVYVPISQGRWGFVRDAVFVALARAARRRTVIHLHGGLFRSFYESSGRVQAALIRRTLSWVDEAWVLTPAHLQMFAGLLEVDRVFVLENTALDMADGAATVAASRGNGFTILFVSALIPEKGCLDLLAAVEQIGAKARGIRVRLVGEVDDEMRRELAERAGPLGRLGVTVDVVGVKMGAAKAAEYRGADLFVLPSRYPPEGQPLVLLEAMSASLPIVSTDHSGIPYTVRDGSEGLIVAPGDIGAIAAAIETLREDEPLRRRLGERARARYEDCYTPEVFYEALGALLARGPVRRGNT